ncbi:MAG: hypothetical protein V8R59_05840 [Enterocloster sp.]
MATGWEKVGDEWYYFHEDGGMNEGQLVLDNAVYEFEDFRRFENSEVAGKYRRRRL